MPKPVEVLTGRARAMRSDRRHAFPRKPAALFGGGHSYHAMRVTHGNQCYSPTCGARRPFSGREVE